MLCGSCTMNGMIPDLAVPGNLERWARLEAAKRRMLYDLDMIGLTEDWLARQATPLQFDFKADAVKRNGQRLRLDNGDPIYTGHADGLITINLKEADPVERERSRIEFGERHRTLVGHFRHEVGHYVWDMLIQNHAANLEAFSGAPSASPTTPATPTRWTGTIKPARPRTGRTSLSAPTPRCTLGKTGPRRGAPT